MKLGALLLIQMIRMMSPVRKDSHLSWENAVFPGKKVGIKKQTDKNTGLSFEVAGRVELSNLLDHYYLMVDLYDCTEEHLIF